MAERIFGQAAAGPYDLIRLAPGESHSLAYDSQYTEEGGLTLSFSYAAPEPEEIRKAVEQARTLAKAFNTEIPDQLAWPTPFRAIEARLDVVIGGAPTKGGKPLFPEGQKTPFEA